MTKRILSLLFAGSFLLCCVFLCGFSAFRVKKGVVANGIDVGGMRLFEAVELIRREEAKRLTPLTITSPAGNVEVTYPELSFTFDAESVLKSAEKGESVQIKITRQWADAESHIQELCDKNAKKAVDAEVEFFSSGFTYRREQKGLVCDYGATLALVTAALKDDVKEVKLVMREYSPQLTESILHQRTQKLSSFTTCFDKSNVNRVHNIRLAAEKLSGAVIEPHKEFSFNARVGRRTAENGFKESVVILDGEFVKGVGGGVCQLSTTLFNAALRAGLKVKESRSHSLAVSYVPPSLDAMVSSYSDLKLVNPFETPVYLSAHVREGSVCVECFGLPDGFRYETESVVLYRLAPPPECVVEGDEDKILRSAKEGVASESYLLKYDQKGKLLSRRLLRRDNYAVVQGIRQIKRQPPPEEETRELPEADEETQTQL